MADQPGNPANPKTRQVQAPEGIVFIPNRIFQLILASSADDTKVNQALCTNSDDCSGTINSISCANTGTCS
jgi:hypothetical protein